MIASDRITAEQAAWYDAHGTVQQQVAEDLAAWCVPELPADGRILEVGCGTGFLTRHLPTGRTCASDPSSAMLETLRTSAPDIETIEAGLHQLPASGWSAVVSSSVLHWVEPFDAAAARLADLAPVCATALMLEGTLAELLDLRRELAPELAPRARFPAAKHAARSLRNAGFLDLRMAVRTYEKTFETGSGCLEELRSAGLTGDGPALSPKQTRDLSRRLARLSPFVAVYKVGFFFGRKR